MAILGIDEVGRGPLAGPLVVGAVILPEKKPKWTDELKDSKKLSFRRREMISEIIIKHAPACGIGWVGIEELNEIGIMEGLKLATRRAVEMVQKQHVKFNQIVIDGNINFLEGTKLESYTTTIIKGDDKIKEISAASIIAKVARDRYMIELSDTYPDYGFERHMGYGTEQHLAAIREYGVCEEHRLFCKPVADALGVKKKEFGKSPKKNTTKIGKKAERAVARYLESLDHDILFMNYENKFAEIDIISWDSDKDKIYFTEVKYRKNDDYGGGLAAIDKEKLEHMELAVKYFMKLHGRRWRAYAMSNPVLAVASVSGPNFKVDDWFELG